MIWTSPWTAQISLDTRTCVLQLLHLQTHRTQIVANTNQHMYYHPGPNKNENGPETHGKGLDTLEAISWAYTHILGWSAVIGELVLLFSHMRSHDHWQSNPLQLIYPDLDGRNGLDNALKTFEAWRQLMRSWCWLCWLRLRSSSIICLRS